MASEKVYMGCLPEHMPVYPYARHMDGGQGSFLKLNNNKEDKIDQMEDGGFSD